MKQRTRRLFRAVPAFILAVLLLLSLIPVTAHADTTPQTPKMQVYEGEIELTGKYNGRFSLDSSDVYLFKLEDMTPGDSWEGKIHVKNTGSRKMEIAILSIVSDLEDTKLFDALQLEISQGETEIYSGSYGGTKEPITKFLPIEGQKTLTFDVKVTFPKECGNEFMDTKMDSTWTFEGRYYGGGGSQPSNPDPIKIQTGVDMTASNSQNAVWLFVSVLCLLSALLMAYRVSSAKKGVKTEKKGRE